MNTFKKIGVVSLLMLSLTLSACSQDVPNDKNRVPADPVTVSQSATANATADPTAAPTLVGGGQNGKGGELPKNAATQSPADSDADKKEFADNPLSINVDKAMESATEDVNAMFPGTDNKEGVRFALATYQELTMPTVWYEARDTKNDWKLVEGTADKMTADLILEIKSGIEKNGRFASIFTVNDKGNVGSMGTDSGDDILLAPKPGATVLSKFNTPSVSASYDVKMGNVINVDGTRTLNFVTTEGVGIEYSYFYHLSVKPDENTGKWQLSRVGISDKTAKVTTQAGK